MVFFFLIPQIFFLKKKVRNTRPSYHSSDASACLPFGGLYSDLWTADKWINISWTQLLLKGKNFSFW